MKKQLSRIATFMFAFLILFTGVLASPSNLTDVQAATTYGFYAKKYVTTYKTGDNYKKYYVTISLKGSPKKSKIKSLKSSSKDVTVEKREGYIVAYFGDKKVTTTISCKIGNKNYSTKLEITEYANPVKSMKFGSTNLTSKFKSTDTYDHNKSFKNKTLSIKMNSNWEITSVFAYNGSGFNKWIGIYKTSFSKKLTMNKKCDAIRIYCRNKKTGVQEVIEIYKKK